MHNKTQLAELEEKFHIEVTGRHVLVTEAMKNYAIDKIFKLERFSPRTIDVQIIMDIQKLEHRVTILMRFNHWKIKIQGCTEDMYASVDKAVGKLQKKLLKYKGKLQDHHHVPTSMVDMNVNVLATSPEDTFSDEIENENLRKMEESYCPHEIVSSETRPLKTLIQHEAVMKMELSEDNFLVYRSEEDQKLKVIYRREDGHFGIIEPE